MQKNWKKLLAYQDDENVLAKLKEIKKEAKAELKKYLKMTQNVEIMKILYLISRSNVSMSIRDSR